MIERFMRNMEAKDYKAMADMMSSRCRYIDYCPSTFNMENYHLYGSEAVEMFFRSKFFFGEIQVSDIAVVSNTRANYIVAYGDIHLYVCAKIEEFDEDGKIKVLVVRPE